jgi:membrane protease YdiL (CAAX protease family)
MNASPPSSELSQTPSHPTSALKQAFIGPNGLRAGWRLLIFVVLVVALLGAFVLIRNGGLQGVREAERRATQIAPTPLLVGGSEAIVFLCVCLATLIMGKLEHRQFSEYGLPLRQALRKDFWIGALWGFLALNGTLVTIFLLHGFRINGLALHGTAIVTSLVEWGIAFLFVGLFEEFLCRGYVQYTLASAIGFWPAALVMSGMFGLGHAFNPGETGIGTLAAGLFGLVFCLFLLRTGNLWFAVGFHAAWDWAKLSTALPTAACCPIIASSVPRSVDLSGSPAGRSAPKPAY